MSAAEQTLCDVIVALGRAGDRPAVLALRKEAVTEWSCAELGGLVAHVAGGLAEAGIGPGARVALLAAHSADGSSPPLPRYTPARLLVPIDPQCDPRTLSHIVDDCGATFWVHVITNGAAPSRARQRADPDRPARRTAGRRRLLQVSRKRESVRPRPLVPATKPSTSIPPACDRAPRGRAAQPSQYHLPDGNLAAFRRGRGQRAGSSRPAPAPRHRVASACWARWRLAPPSSFLAPSRAPKSCARCASARLRRSSVCRASTTSSSRA